MSRKRNQPHPKGKSLIAVGKINPIQWHISRSEAAVALRKLGLSVKQVKRVNCLKHQVCISYWDTQGRVCSSFFSYRVFECWYEAVEALIYKCVTVEEWDSLGDIIEFELVQFPYPVAIADQIWENLKAHWYALKPIAA